jgi:hypothetical protein
VLGSIKGNLGITGVKRNTGFFERRIFEVGLKIISSSFV